MTNTPFSKRCEIIRDFAEVYRGEEWAEDYFSFYTLGVPWAIGVAYGDIIVNEQGVEYVDMAYEGLLKLFGVDKYADLDSLSELLAISDLFDDGVIRAEG